MQAKSKDGATSSVKLSTWRVVVGLVWRKSDTAQVKTYMTSIRFVAWTNQLLKNQNRLCLSPMSITRSFLNAIYSFFTQGSWVSSLGVGSTNYSPVANGHFLPTRSLTFQRTKWAFFFVLRQVKKNNCSYNYYWNANNYYLRRLLRGLPTPRIKAKLNF